MKRKILVIIIITLCLGFFSVFNVHTGRSEVTKDAFFYISILAPSSCPFNPLEVIPVPLIENLPKIGIGVDTFDHTGWAQITPRTWDYPGPFPIPSYDEGGYDILPAGWSCGLDWDPAGLYDTAGITPNGDNFYQYSNKEMDWAIGNYTASFLLEDRLNYVKQIQALLYNDLPQISVFYPLYLYAMDEAFDQSSWDGLLWSLAYQPMENWSCGAQTTFKYATSVDFVDFHPLFCKSIYDAQWLKQIYNGILERNALPPYLRGYSSRLATSWNSADGLLYTVNINPNAVWADGTPLTSYDVNYTYNLVLNSVFDPWGWYFKCSKYMDNNSITIISDYQYTIQFKESNFLLDSILAIDLLPKHIWDGIPPANHKTQAYSWAKTDPSKIFGVGPYKLEEYDSTNNITHLTRNDYFDDWSGITPNFADVYFIYYDNRDEALLDLSTNTIDMIDCHFLLSLDEIPAGCNHQLVEDIKQYEIAINQYHPYLGTGESCPIAGKESARHVRQAISHIIPRQDIIDKLSSYRYYSIPATTGCPHGVVGYDESLKPYEYNVTHALEHMALAGFPVTFSVHVSIGFYFSTILFIITLFGGTVHFRHQKQKYY